MFYYLLIVICFFTITYIWGSPIWLLLEKNKTSWVSAATCSALGTSVGMVVMYYFSCLELSVSQMAWPLTVFFCGISLVVFFHNNKWKELNRDKARIIISWLIITASITVIFAFPGVVMNQGILPILLGNNDFSLYSATSNAVKYYGEENVIEKAGEAANWVFGSQNRYVDFWIAFISHIFKIDIFNSAWVFSIYCIGLLAFSVISLAHTMSRKAYTAGIICLACVLNYNTIYSIFQGFIAQLYGTAIICIIILKLFIIWKQHNLDIKQAISTGIIITGLSATYVEMIPIIVVPMLFLLFYCFILEKRRAITLAYSYFVMAGVIALVFPKAYYSAIKMALFSSSSYVGWDIPPGGLVQAFGLYNYSFLEKLDNGTIITIINLALFIGMCVLLIKKYDKRTSGFMLAFLTSWSVLYEVFLLFFDSYKAWKLLAVVFPFYVVSGVMSICIDKKIEGTKKSIVNAVLVLFVLWVSLSGYGIYSKVLAMGEAIGEGKRPANNVLSTYITKDQEELDSFFSITDYSKIYISAYPYFDHVSALTMSIPENGSVFDTNGVLLNTFDNAIPNEKSISVDSPSFCEPIYFYGEEILENESYIVRKMDLSYPFCLNRQTLGSLQFLGLNDNTTAYVAREISDEKTTLEFYISEDRVVDIFFGLDCETNQTIEIEIPNGTSQKIMISKGKNDFSIEEVSFYKGINKMIIRRVNQDASNIYLRRLSFDDEERIEKPYVPIDINKYSIPSIQDILQSIRNNG